MTREEAIKLLKQYQGYEPMFPDGEKLKHAFDLTDETVDTLLAALRGPTREMVERIRGEWIHTHSTDNFWAEVLKCSYCGFEDDNEDCFDFCPECGQPKTDEAVQMVMERLEELHETI